MQQNSQHSEQKTESRKDNTDLSNEKHFSDVKSEKISDSSQSLNSDANQEKMDPVRKTSVLKKPRETEEKSFEPKSPLEK